MGIMDVTRFYHVHNLEQINGEANSTNTIIVTKKQQKKTIFLASQELY